MLLDQYMPLSSSSLSIIQQVFASFSTINIIRYAITIIIVINHFFHYCYQSFFSRAFTWQGLFSLFCMYSKVRPTYLTNLNNSPTSNKGTIPLKRSQQRQPYYLPGPNSCCCNATQAMSSHIHFLLSYIFNFFLIISSCKAYDFRITNEVGFFEEIIAEDQEVVGERKY